VRQIRRHVNHVAGLGRVRFAAQGKLALAGQNLNDGRLRGSVFGQFLTFSEAEQHDPRIRGAQQRPAHDAVGGKLGFIDQRQYFFLCYINQRLLAHATNIAWQQPLGIDASQTSCRWLVM